MNKICTKCLLPYDLSEFSKNRRNPDGLSSWCKSCHKAAAKEYRQRFKDQDARRAVRYVRGHSQDHKKYLETHPHVRLRAQFKKHYKISLKEYELLLVSQEDRCAICGRHREEFPKPLVVDHDHLTGKVRGLLCPNCNHGLGRFKDSVEVLTRAVEYLRRNNER